MQASSLQSSSDFDCGVSKSPDSWIADIFVQASEPRTEYFEVDFTVDLKNWTFEILKIHCKGGQSKSGTSGGFAHTATDVDFRMVLEI